MWVCHVFAIVGMASTTPKITTATPARAVTKTTTTITTAAATAATSTITAATPTQYCKFYLQGIAVFLISN